MIDTHCHLYDKKLYNQLDKIIENAKNNNIQKMICIGDRLSTSDQSIKIAEKITENYNDNKIYSVAGGGDTVSLLNNLNKINNFNFVSTAGGAFLEYLEGKELPGIKALN